MTRRFQFSLRALLVVLTIAGLSLGWLVERAHRRGRAIDSILSIGGRVWYQPDVELTNKSAWWKVPTDHLWLDIERRRVRIAIPENADLDKALARALKQVSPIDMSNIGSKVDDGS